MWSRRVLCYVAIGFLILGICLDEAEARRKILRGRRTLLKSDFKGRLFPPWATGIFLGLGLLAATGVLYFGLKRWIVDSVDSSEIPTYHRAMSDEV